MTAKKPTIGAAGELQPPTGDNAEKKVRIYACGGCGINIANKLEFETEQFSGRGLPDIVRLDTSRSNLRTGVEYKNLFLIDGKDGAGKIRRENYPEIAAAMGQIVLEHGPLDLSIVLFSASGGTGSVFGPLLIGELLKKSASVVGVMIGSTESAITAENTLNTFKSLDGIVKTSQCGAALFYEENPRDSGRGSVDATVLSVLNALLVMGSGNHFGLDTKDVGNFLRFDLGARVPPQLALLDIISSEEQIAGLRERKLDRPLSVLSIHASDDFVPLPVSYSYLAEGCFLDGKQNNAASVHFLIDNAELPALVKRLDGIVGEYAAVANSRQQPTALFGSGGASKADDLGMVL